MRDSQSSRDDASQAKHTMAADHHGHGDVEQASLVEIAGEGEWTCRDVDDEAQESDTARREIRRAERDSKALNKGLTTVSL